jgi:hypothetical protein
MTTDAAGPREQAIRERLRTSLHFSEWRGDVEYLLARLDALRPEEPPPQDQRLSSRWQELFWALPSGEMRSKLRSLEIDVGRELAEVASLRAQLTQQSEYYQSALAGHVELQNDRVRQIKAALLNAEWAARMQFESKTPQAVSWKKLQKQLNEAIESADQILARGEA